MSEIRSVSVHLDADVAGYIAKMKLAGAATDQAFGRAGPNIDNLNTRLTSTESELGKVSTQAGRVESSVRRLDGTVGRSGNNWTTYTKKVGGFVDKLVVLPGLAVAAASALQPLAIAGAGVAAAFAPPVAFAGGGLGLFAILGGFAVSQTNKEIKAIDAAQKKLSGLTKGTKEYAAAQRELRDAQKALSPAQREYADSLEHLQSTFADSLRGKTGEALLGPISASLDLAAKLLPKVQPIITSVSHGLETLIGDLSDFSETNEFTKFVHNVAHQAGPDLVIAGRALGDFVHGIGDLLVVGGKSSVSQGLLRSLGHLSQDFSDWAGSKDARRDVRGFLDYFHQIGPDVASTIGAVADAIAQISKALAPISPVTLGVIRGISNAIANIPVPVLTALAGGAAGLSIFSKLGGFEIAELLGGVFGGGKSGGGPFGGGSKFGGATPVYVVNMPPGGPGGGVPGAPGGPRGGPGLLTKIGFGAAGIAAVGAIEIGTQALLKREYGDFLGTVFAHVSQSILHLPAPDLAGQQVKLWRDFFNNGTSAIMRDLGINQHHSTGAGAPPVTGAAAVIAARNGAAGLLADAPEKLKATSTAVEGLNARLGKASQGMELVGRSADRAFPDATRQVTTLSGKMASINGGHASAAFDLIGHSAAANSAQAGGAIDSLHRRIDSLPSNKTVNVKANGGQALSTLRAVAIQLNALHDRTIHLTTVRSTGGRSLGGDAAGGTVPGPRYPYGDKVLRMLAPGEEVISNSRGQADRFRPLLKRINGMADGGTVTAQDLAAGTSGGLFINATASATGELHRLKNALRESTKELDDEKQHRQDLAQQRAQLVSTVESSFRSQVFGVSGADNGIWAPGAAAMADPAQILRKDIRGARQYDADIKRLRRRGLSKGVLATITTLDEAEQASGESNRELREISRLFALRQKVSRQAATTLGNTVLGKRIDESNRHLKAIRSEVHQTNERIHDLERAQKQHAKDIADHVAHGVNKGAANAARTKQRGGT